jgi:hypothetical protein
MCEILVVLSFEALLPNAMCFAQWRSEYLWVRFSTDAVWDLDLDRDLDGFFGFLLGIGDSGLIAFAENFDMESCEEFLRSGARPVLDPRPTGDGALYLLLWPLKLLSLREIVEQLVDKFSQQASSGTDFRDFIEKSLASKIFSLFRS